MNVDISGYSIMRDFPKIVISSYEIPIPPALDNNNRYFEISEKILENENIGTILNVATEVKKTILHDKMYEKLGIKYMSLGITDELYYPPPEDFLDQVLDIYNEHNAVYKDKAFLVNCVSGINRSALAIAGILWKTTIPRKWETPIEMIDYMRKIQLNDRGIWLLNNETFEEYLIKWCGKN